MLHLHASRCFSLSLQRWNPYILALSDDLYIYTIQNHSQGMNGCIHSPNERTTDQMNQNANTSTKITLRTMEKLFRLKTFWTIYELLYINIPHIIDICVGVSVVAAFCPLIRMHVLHEYMFRSLWFLSFNAVRTANALLEKNHCIASLNFRRCSTKMVTYLFREFLGSSSISLNLWISVCVCVLSAVLTTSIYCMWNNINNNNIDELWNFSV